MMEVEVVENGTGTVPKEEVREESRFIEPRPRPRITQGVTIETFVGCGKLYVTINRDRHGIVEVFAKLGKSGGCSASQTEAIGKLISLALRCNVNPLEVVRKLKGIRCPSVTWQDGEQITSCADAIAKVLERYVKGEYGKFDPVGIIPLTEFTKEEQNPQPEPEEVKPPDPQEERSGFCPECGGQLLRQEGCNICPNCGYSKCG
jgi:ribonucleoside-diphosphate reductase alpha chain